MNNGQSSTSTMSWLKFLRFFLSCVLVPEFPFFEFGISISSFFGLGISMSWYVCLHIFVFVFIKKTEKIPQN